MAITLPGEPADFAPRFTTRPNFTDDYGAQAVGTVGAADVDEDITDASTSVDPVVFAIVDVAGQDGDAFAINPATGALALLAPASLATKPNYAVTVSITDSALNVVEQTLSVVVVEPFETIYIQGETFTDIPDNNSGQPDNLIRTQTQNPEAVGTANTGLPNYDTFGFRPGYTGTGYYDINGTTQTGPQGYVDFTAPAGTYAITLRLANGSGNARPLTINIDSVVAQIADTNTGAFYTWQERTVTLTLATGGTHRLTILQNNTNGAPNIDAIAIARAGEPVNFAAPTITGPVAFIVNENQTAVGAIVASDLDVNGNGAGDTLTYSLDGADKDLFTISAGGVLAFVAAPDFETSAAVGGGNVYSLDVIVSDGAASVTRAVTVTVADVAENAPPSALDETAETPEDTAVIIDLAGLIGDAEDGEPEIIEATSDDGVVTIVGTTLSFTPDADFNGEAVIAYTVEDGDGATASGSVTVTVTPVNDAPMLAEGATLADLAATAGVEQSVDLSALDATDPDGTSPSYAVRLQGGGDAPAGVAVVGGQLVVGATVPAGVYSLEVYATDDDDAESATAAFTLTVEEAEVVNTPPTALDERPRRPRTPPSRSTSRI